jgi:UDP-glucose 6-dehydrogenase
VEAWFDSRNINNSSMEEHWQWGVKAIASPALGDDAALARKIGARADVAEATDRINNHQIDRLANLVAKFAKAGTRIALLGLSYKPQTPVVEESHSVKLAARLADAGYIVSVHDPLAQAAAVAMLGDKVVEAYRWRKRCVSAIS